jgi:hypothetical protein
MEINLIFLYKLTAERLAREMVSSLSFAIFRTLLQSYEHSMDSQRMKTVVFNLS